MVNCYLLQRHSTSIHATYVGVFAMKQIYLEPCTLGSILSSVFLLLLSQQHTLISVQIILYRLTLNLQLIISGILNLCTAYLLTHRQIQIFHELNV